METEQTKEQTAEQAVKQTKGQLGRLKREFLQMHIVVKALLITVLLEFTVCQYRSYCTLGNQPETVKNAVFSSNVSMNGDGSVTVMESEGEIVWPAIKILNVEAGDVNALKLKITRIRGTEPTPLEVKQGAVIYEDGRKVEEATRMNIYAADEGNSLTVLYGEHVTVAGNAASEYMRLHCYGDCREIWFELYASPGDTIFLEELIINPRIPFQISGLRMGLIFLTVLFVIYVNPKGKYYEIMWSETSGGQRRAALATACLLVLVFVWAVGFNPSELVPEWEYHRQYSELAEAFTKGRLYLDREAPSWLAEMENPYDPIVRTMYEEYMGEECLWDGAYFNGRYYVYFGVLPVLIFYLPWYVAFGTAFPTWLGILLTGIMLIFAVFRLSWTIMKRYFRDRRIPYAAWLMCTILVVVGSGAPLIMRRPDFYSFPILLGVTLSVWGIDLWMESVRENGIRTWQLTLGCLCMALVAACRPQLLLGSLLIFPIYWDAVFKKRHLFSAKSWGKTALAILMYAAVAAGVMTYNYCRFGNVFDFGANYNLTTNDMLHRGFQLDRIWTAIFRYLFQLPQMSAQFPYFEGTSIWTSYLGITVSEVTFGGFLTMNLLVTAALYFALKKRWFAEKQVWAMVWVLFGSAFALILIDAEMAGILPRYFYDFGWLFYLGAILTWFSVWAWNEGKPERIHLLRIGQNLAFAIAIGFYFLMLFTDESVCLRDWHPERFYQYYYQLAFWA